MPARGTGHPRTYQSADYHINRISVLLPDVQRLKDQSLSILPYGEEGDSLLKRIREELNDSLLLSREVITKPDVYRHLSNALESRNVQVSSSVVDINGVSFVAMQIIAAIWNRPEDKVKRDSLLLEYQNRRNMILAECKHILSGKQDQSTRTESGKGPSSCSKHSPTTDIDSNRRNSNQLSSKYRKPLPGREMDDESPDEDPQGHHPEVDEEDQHIFSDNDDRSADINVQGQVEEARSAVDGGQSVKIIQPELFNASGDRNITGNVRQTGTENTANQPFDNSNTTVNKPQDATNEPLTDTINASSLNSVSDLISVMKTWLEKSADNSNHYAQCPTGSTNSWNEAKAARRKNRKAICSLFSERLFSGDFGEHWYRHQNRFVKICIEWEVLISDYVDFIQETLTGHALIYAESKIQCNRDITWSTLSKLMNERYNGINRQRDASHRLSTMKYEDFQRRGEPPTSTLDRITAYIDRMAVLALPFDRTEEAKARFLSNVIKGQTWVYHSRQNGIHSILRLYYPRLD